MEGQSFEQEFLQGVKASVAAEEKPKRKIDVRLVAALAAGAVVIVGWVVWVVFGGGDRGGASVTGKWSCDDGSVITLGEDKSVIWSDDVGTISGEYGIGDDGKAIFGTVSVKPERDGIVITRSSGEQIYCDRGRRE